MNDPARDFNEVIRAIRRDDPRYARGAYYFLRQALDYSLKELHARGQLDQSNHLSGKQLLEGIRLFAIDQYGPMARSVLMYWGIKSCCDFGNIVFQLVSSRVLGKTENDKPEDDARSPNHPFPDHNHPCGNRSPRSSNAAREDLVLKAPVSVLLCWSR